MPKMTVDYRLSQNGGISLEFCENLKIPCEYNAQDDAVSAEFKGVLKQIGTEYKLTGRLEIKAVFSCDCCLKPVEKSFDREIDEVFSKANGDCEEVYLIDSDSEIDLSGCIMANVIMAMPMKVVCREDCKGLCPMCGINLNEGDCNCKKARDPRFEVLRSLLKSEEV